MCGSKLKANDEETQEEVAAGWRGKESLESPFSWKLWLKSVGGSECKINHEDSDHWNCDHVQVNLTTIYLVRVLSVDKPEGINSSWVFITGEINYMDDGVLYVSTNDFRGVLICWIQRKIYQLRSLTVNILNIARKLAWDRL